MSFSGLCQKQSILNRPKKSCSLITHTTSDTQQQVLESHLAAKRVKRENLRKERSLLLFRTEEDKRTMQCEFE